VFVTLFSLSTSLQPLARDLNDLYASEVPLRQVLTGCAHGL
jgi:hypothetical protein